MIPLRDERKWSKRVPINDVSPSGDNRFGRHLAACFPGRGETGSFQCRQGGWRKQEICPGGS